MAKIQFLRLFMNDKEELYTYELKSSKFKPLEKIGEICEANDKGNVKVHFHAVSGVFRIDITCPAPSNPEMEKVWWEILDKKVLSQLVR